MSIDGDVMAFPLPTTGAISYTGTPTVDYSRLYLSSIHKGYNWTVKYVPMIF